MKLQELNKILLLITALLFLYNCSPNDNEDGNESENNSEIPETPNPSGYVTSISETYNGFTAKSYFFNYSGGRLNSIREEIYTGPDWFRTHELFYGSNDKILTRTVLINNDIVEETFVHEYDVEDRLIRVEILDSNNEFDNWVEYTYNDLGLIETYNCGSCPQMFFFNYDQNRQLLSRTYGENNITYDLTDLKNPIYSLREDFGLFMLPLLANVSLAKDYDLLANRAYVNGELNPSSEVIFIDKTEDNYPISYFNDFISDLWVDITYQNY